MLLGPYLATRGVEEMHGRRRFQLRLSLSLVPPLCFDIDTAPPPAERPRRRRTKMSTHTHNGVWDENELFNFPEFERGVGGYEEYALQPQAGDRTFSLASRLRIALDFEQK